MGFDEYFEKKRRYQPDYRFRDKHSKHGHYYSRHENGYHSGIKYYLYTALRSRRLRIFVLVVSILIIMLVVGAIILLFPLINKMFDYISQNGIQGVIDAIYEFLSQLWKGTGN